MIKWTNFVLERMKLVIELSAGAAVAAACTASNASAGPPSFFSFCTCCVP